MRDYLKESSVSCLSDGLTLSLQHPSRLYSFAYSLVWRDMLPAFDLDVERRSLQHISRSMLRQCRPSLKSTLSATISLDSRDNPVLPTSGSSLRLQLVSTFPRFDVGVQRAAGGRETPPNGLLDVAEFPAHRAFRRRRRSRGSFGGVFGMGPKFGAKARQIL